MRLIAPPLRIDVGTVRGSRGNGRAPPVVHVVAAATAGKGTAHSRRRGPSDQPVTIGRPPRARASCSSPQRWPASSGARPPRSISRVLGCGDEPSSLPARARPRSRRTAWRRTARVCRPVASSLTLQPHDAIGIGGRRATRSRARDGEAGSARTPIRRACQTGRAVRCQMTVRSRGRGNAPRRG